jgi:hypothetical protein
MCYYDHAVAMALKLDRWGDPWITNSHEHSSHKTNGSRRGKTPFFALAAITFGFLLLFSWDLPFEPYTKQPSVNGPVAGFRPIAIARENFADPHQSAPADCPALSVPAASSAGYMSAHRTISAHEPANGIGNDPAQEPLALQQDPAGLCRS